MPSFKYEALDAQGKEQNGQLEAVNRIAALLIIKKRGLSPSSLEEIKDVKRQPSSPRSTSREMEAQFLRIIRESRERSPEQTTVSKEANMALVKCKDCGKDVSRDASKCPNCGANMMTADDYQNGCLLFLGGGVVLTILFGWLLMSPSPSAPGKSVAFYMSQQFVKDELKAPSTADFPSYNESFVSDLGGGKFSVSAYVDSQNSFGAKLRNHYTCVLKSEGGDRWRKESLDIGDDR